MRNKGPLWSWAMPATAIYSSRYFSRLWWQGTSCSLPPFSCRRTQPRWPCMKQSHAFIRVSSFVASAQKCDRAAFHPAHTPHLGLAGQFVQQRLGVFKVRGVEAFGEPVVDFGEHRARLVATAGITQQPCENHRGTQFVGLRTHLLGKQDRVVEIGLGQVGLADLEAHLAASCESIRPIE